MRPTTRPWSGRRLSAPKGKLGACRPSPASTSKARRPSPKRKRCLQPTDRARELVRGAYDLHVHVEPDLAKRRIDDIDLAHRFAELGLAGFVLKSHYVPT